MFCLQPKLKPNPTMRGFQQVNIMSSASCLILLCITLDATVQAFVPSPQQHSIAHPRTSTQALQKFPAITTTSDSSWDQRLGLKNLQQNNGRTGRSSSTLTMVATPATVAAITGAVTGGIFAGGLHAIAGE